MTEHTLLIAGGRDFANYELLRTTVGTYAQTLGKEVQLIIVSGMAKGADLLAVRYANEHRLEIIECRVLQAYCDRLRKRNTRR